MNQVYDQMKCIWMGSAGVEYKLCDRAFDCENCQFDKVIRNMLGSHGEEGMRGFNLVQTCAEKIKSEKFDNNLIWFRNHLVGKRMFGNTSSIGFSPLIRYLIDEATTVTYDTKKDAYQRGETLFTIKGDWGETPVPSPVNMSVCNFFVTDQSVLRAGNQWIALVVFDSQDETECVMDAKEFITQRDTLSDYLLSFDYQNLPVGETMHDGANPVKSLHTITGITNFRRLLAMLLEGK